MIKQALASVLSIVAAATPVQSQVAIQPLLHKPLVEAIQRAGVSYEVNSKHCEHGMQGFYYRDEDGKYIIGVCQAASYAGGPEKPWTPNDFDTLRHEAFHLVQDCIVDGEINLVLHQFFDGPGGMPGDVGLDKVIEDLGPERALKIWQSYHKRGLSPEGIYMEIEAFSVARFVSPGDIAKLISKFCRS